MNVAPSTFLESALELARCGFAVLPLPTTRQEAFDQRRVQTRDADEAQNSRMVDALA